VAGLGKLRAAPGQTVYDLVRYGKQGERAGHGDTIERVLPALGPGGVWAAARAGRHPALGPGGVWAAAFERVRYGNLLAGGNGAAGAKPKWSAAPYHRSNNASVDR